MITYDPSGGDLGRAELKPITAVELQIIIPHVASLLDGLAGMKISPLPFKYAFEVFLDEKDGAKFVINASKLPSKVSWYEIEGRKLFEIRGPSGGIATSYICYLVTK